MARITIADIDQAEAALADEKKAYYDAGKAPQLRARFEAAKRTLVELRTAWRRQEEAAGTRSGLVGGDATTISEKDS